MAAKVLNRSFEEAKRLKEDEFYTQLPDIERELRHYRVSARRSAVAGSRGLHEPRSRRPTKDWTPGTSDLLSGP